MTDKYKPLRKGEQLFLRGCQQDGTSYGGFQWPLKVGAKVMAPDWDPKPVCGLGLHGHLNGGGNSNILVAAGIGLVVAAKNSIDLGGKHKFQKCRVLYVGGTLGDAATWLASHPQLPSGSVVHYAAAMACYRGTATAGDFGTATAGYRGAATAGYRGAAMAGDFGTATAGCGTATAGARGTATAGDGGIATAGYRGTATAGGWGTATVGHYGTATAGLEGTATAGDRGTATAGDYGGSCPRSPTAPV